MTDAPRRRIEATIKIGADSWRDLQGALRCLETEIAISGSLSRFSVSGGYSFGWIVETDEDETVTHESWAEALMAHLDEKRRPVPRWITHQPGRCPVHPDTQVRVRFRGGGTSSRFVPAFFWDKLWRGEGMHRSNDIVAYALENPDV